MESIVNSTSEAKPGTGTANKSSFQGNSTNTNVMHSFKEKKNEPSAIKVLLVLLFMAGLGVGTGYGTSLVTAGKATGSTGGQTATSTVPDNPQKGQTYGDGDTATFKDTAEGVLKEGGIEGEGQYHLEREGGESQYVYLISSTVDLSKLIDKKIKVWGQTQAAQKAGWLMDVGKVEVL